MVAAHDPGNHRVWAGASKLSRAVVGLAVLAGTVGLVLALGPAAARAVALSPGPPLSFQVNSTADTHDASPGDGRCADSTGHCTLRAAIEEANAQPAGTSVAVRVPAGIYDLTLGTLAVSASTIVIKGAGAASTTVAANDTFRVMQIGPGVTASLTGLTITGGNAGDSGYGGGVLSFGKLSISRSVLAANQATAGGGIANSGGTLTISGSTINGNTAFNYGGGGIQNGGLKNLPGTVTVTGSTVKGNICGGDGGGILNGQNGHPAMTGRPHPASPLLGLTVTGSTIGNNSSFGAGGGIANEGGTALVTGSALERNTAPIAIGGGISSFGILTVTRSTLRRNHAGGGYGGGIEVFGGGVPGSVTIIQSTLDHNSADVGGGIDDSAAVHVIQSTLSGNTAAAGGGIMVEGSSSLTVLNSTLTGNTATQSGNGGGIQTFACGRGTISYTTIAGNSTGLDLSCPDVQLTGTIMASSTAANCVGSTPAESAGYNLDSGTSCGFTRSTDLNATNPDLGPLASNGGPTLTERPLAGSPAIDAGGQPGNGCPATDQRGFPRPHGTACDMGSVQVQS